MDETELIRKTVGKRQEKRGVFQRIRDLNSSLAKIGVKANDDGEHIRRIVGRPRR